LIFFGLATKNGYRTISSNTMMMIENAQWEIA